VTVDDLILTTLQEERTTGVRLYRPHTAPAPKGGIDWAALTPSCSSCGTKTGALNRDDQCTTCAPPPEPVTVPAPVPAPAPAPKRRPGRPKKEKRAPRTGPAGGRPPIELDEAAIIEAYTGGQPASSIGEALGCSSTPIVRILKTAGVELRIGRQRAVQRTRGPGRPGRQVDEQAIVAEYQTGATAPTIANRHGILPKRVRSIVERHGVQLRDDRNTRSGGTPKEYDADTCAAVERLYVVEELSRSQVAERLGLPYKSVVTIMRRRGVRPREGQSGRTDTLGGLRQLLDSASATSREIKVWGCEHGLVDHVARGMPAKALVEAYMAARDLGVAP
jgi:hypothetical protein